MGLGKSPQLQDSSLGSQEDAVASLKHDAFPSISVSGNRY